MTRGLRIAAIGGVLLAASSAGAAVTQPDSTPLPQPTPSTEISLVTSRGFSADADTLAGLFKYFNGGADAAIDPINDAATTPGIFPGQCGFKVQIVLKGGACKNAFGWYNATIPATTPSAIYPLVPASLTAASPNGIGCLDGDFCPLATRTTSQAPQHAWADPLPGFSVDVRSNPSWAGGPVGFALLANSSGGQCSQTKYTQADLNAKSSTGVPWITALVYHSKADAGAYYLAFEDLPTCTGSWRGCMLGSDTVALPSGQGNDGDFNADVFYVTGLICSLAGGAPDAGIDASSSGAAGTTGAGGANSGAAGSGGAPGAGGAGGGAGDAGSAGTAGTAGTTGAAGATGAAGMSGGAAGIGGMNSFAGASGSAGRTGATGAAGHSQVGITGTDSTGCGCDLTGREPSWWLVTLVLGGLLMARRRRHAIAIKRDQ
jgi:MYXO-CTERM domain-containing protein